MGRVIQRRDRFGEFENIREGDLNYGGETLQGFFGDGILEKAIEVDKDLEGSLIEGIFFREESTKVLPPSPPLQGNESGDIETLILEFFSQFTIRKDD